MKKVSVIVPCYNTAQYLRKCVDYLLEQTIGLENMEIILIDDASTDNGETWKVIMEYEGQYPETVTAIHLQQNVRQGGARNVGISYARGEYLIFCDADDWLLKETLAHCYAAAKEYDADVVEFLFKEVRNHEDTVMLEKGENDQLISLESEEQRKKFLMYSSERLSFGSQKKFYRRSMIQENQIRFAEHLFFEEPSFMIPIRVYEKKHFFLDEKLYIRFLSQGSAMRSNWVIEHKWDNLKVWVLLMNDLMSKSVFWIYHEELEYLFFKWGIQLSIRSIFIEEYVLTEEEWRMLNGISLKLFSGIPENPYIKRDEEGKICSLWEELMVTLLKMEITGESVKIANQSIQEVIQVLFRGK